MDFTISIAESYSHCSEIARSHYENFPVASLLLPRALRPHVAAVYAFARAADDMADEGADAPELRLLKLDFWEGCLERCIAVAAVPSAGRETSGSAAVAASAMKVFPALGDTIAKFGLTLEPFRNLLDAFRQDAVGTSFGTFDELLDYCRRSANPVGRILLALFAIEDERAAPPADDLCTGLQLANFWQDLSIDLARGRNYIPEEDVSAFGCEEHDLRNIPASTPLKRLLGFQVSRTREFLLRSAALPPLLPCRFGLELRAIREGGLRILEKIARLDYNVLMHRPKIRKSDFLIILLRAATRRR